MTVVDHRRAALALIRQVRARLITAQQHGDVMRNPSVDQKRRDLATQSYVRTVDDLIDDLAALDRMGLLADLERRTGLSVEGRT